MAGNYTVDVSVALKAQQASIKNIRKQIETEFGEVDFNSSVGKKLSKLFDQFDNRISNMDSILGKGVLNASDLSKLGALFDSMNLIVGQMRSAAGKAPLMDLGIDPNEVPEIVAAMKELQKVQAKISAEENQSSKEALKAMNKQKTLEKMKELEGSKSSEDKSLRENERIIEAEYQQRKAAQEKLQQELDSLEAKRKSKLQEQAIEEQKARDTREAAQAKQLEAREKKLVEKNAIKKIKTEQGKTFKSQQQNINDFINQVYSDGAIAAEAHLKSSGLAGSLVRALFSDDEMDALAGQSAEKFRQAFQAKLFENGGKSINQQNLDTVINTAQDWGRNNPETSAQAQRTANILQQQVSQHELNSQNAGIEANAIQTEIEGKTQELNNLSVEVAKFSAVVSELSNAASELRASVDSKYKDELNNAQKGLQGAHQNAKMKMIPSTEPGNPAFQRGGVDSGLNSINMAQEADSFTARMKQGIKQWMGAREVIGYIKQGIRSAYQDIQGLDKAMTNIAVVTDMSTSDLWGKIDQYMGMAQKYGVTTQGVYEVSQLFFQQGLGEADTMAATVETLKMARIAGMDYKDAADGMTVAIRGFNMEMSEAAHVTDVYSKVAAITASDTQELVSAMSKTASSAASVGSSFENTTAMLAVMVEATRESPQNIGSAMKSIISRYGEMTKGLSEDSEGEEIDYNRVDTALKSIGISLKDAQGQFRDFDDVIFELSDKWSTLDSVTQRYIATIFAGNRQQSRFLALVSNADRLQEVSDAAANSEDAGLLQYSKTMDSLETKINNIKTSFQQFYMDIFNGPLIGKGLDFINNMIKGFNKLGKLTSVMNIASIILGVKALVNLLVQPFGQIGNIISRSIEEGMRNGFANARAYGEQGGEQMGEGVQDGMSSGSGGGSFFWNHIGEFASLAQMAGGALSAWGSRVASSGTADNAGEMLQRGHNLSTAGNILSGAGTGASVGMAFGPWGALIGAALGGITAAIVSWFNRPDELDKAMAEQEKAEEEAQEKQVTRAEAVQRETDLEATIEKLKELKKHQYDSAEAQQAFVDANNEAFEKFPELAATFDSAGNAIMDVTTAEQALALARQTSAQATYEAMVAEIKKVEKQTETNKLQQKEHLDNATTVLKDKSLMAGSYITDAVAEEMRRHSTSDYQSMVNLELGRMGMEEYINEAGQNARQRVLDEGGNSLAAWRAEQNARSTAQEEFIQQHEQEAYATVAESFKTEAIQAATAPYLQGASLEDQQFLLDYYGSRYVNEEDADLARSQGRTDVAQNSFSTLTENGEKTFENISGVASTFITKAITSLDQSDQETANFLKTLGDTASDTDAMGMILQNFQSLAWDEGVDPTLFMSKFFGYDYSTSEGRDAFDKLIGDYQNLLFEEQRLGQAGIATRKTLASYNTNTYIDNDTDRAKSVDSIAGARGYLQQIASNYVDNNVGQDASYFTADKIQREIADETAQFENFEELSRALGVSDEVSALNQSAISGNITRESWMSQLEDLNVVNPETLAFLNDFAETYLFKDSEQLKLNAVKALQQSSIAWSTNITRTDLDGLGTDNILNDIADNYVSSITQFNNYLEDSVESGNMSQRTANQMAREYLSVWEASTTLPAEQIAEAQRLISEADLTTTLGKEDLKANLEDAGIYDDALVAEIDGVYPYAENLVTQYGQLEDKLINGLESMSDALSGASEGMNMSEAQKVANKVGKDLLDLFNFQDGQYVAKDANALREIQEAYATEEKAALNESYENQIRILQEEGTTETIWDYDEDGFYAPVTPGSFIAPSEEYTHLMEQYGEAANAWYQDLIQNDQLELEGLTGGETSSQIVQAYLTDLKEDTEKAIDQQTEYLVEQAQQALEINNRTFELEGGVQGRNKREAFDLLASNGLTGYSAKQIAQLETYLGVGAGGLGARETDIGTGEYELGAAQMAQLMSQIPQWVENSINSSIEETLNATKEGFESVGEAIVSGETLSTAEISKMLGEGFEDLDDVRAEVIKNLYNDVIESGNFETLQIVLSQLFQDRGASETEANRMASESAARLEDQVRESQEKLIDLSISALEGDISAEDALKLGAQGIDVDELINRTQEAISALVQSIVDNTDISFSDKKSKLESVYNAGLESLLGYETSIADSLTNREGMSRSDASSMMAELTALGVKTTGLFEESADGTKFYLNNVTDIMNDLTRTIQDESTNPQQRAAAENLLKQVRYVQEWQPYELADSMGSTIEEMANATEISTIEMRDFYKELTGRDISVEDAQHLRDELNELDPVARIERLVEIARSTGIEVEGLEERLQEAAANVLDTIIEAISNGLSSIGDGLNGTLDFTSLNELMQRYDLSVQDSIGTASGVTLGEQDRQNLVTAMYREAQSAGLQAGFGDQLWSTFRDSDNSPYAGYNALEAEITRASQDAVRAAEEATEAANQAISDRQAATEARMLMENPRGYEGLNGEVEGPFGDAQTAVIAEATAAQAELMAENTAQAAEEARIYAEALQQARAAAMFDENAYEFTFMEQDATNGLTRNADNFINQIDTVKGIFESFSNEEAIGYQDFYNMMDFLNTTGQWESFSENITNAGIEYEDFVNSVVAHTDEWGKVDIGGVAAEMGVSVDTAMEAMSGSMQEGLKTVAREQVEYLSGVEEMLQAMLVMEEVGDIGLGINVQMGEETKTVQQWLNDWDDLDEETQKTFILKMSQEVEEDRYFGVGGISNAMHSALDGMFGEGYAEFLDSNIFSRDQSTGEITGVIDAELAKQYMDFASVLSKATLDGSGELAQGVASAAETAKNAYLESVGVTYEELTSEQRLALLEIMTNAVKNATPLDLAAFADAYHDALLAGDTEGNIPISSGVNHRFTLNSDGTVTVYDEDGNEITEASQLASQEVIQEAINSQRSNQDQVYTVSVDADGRITYNIIPQEVHTYLSQENLQTDFSVELGDGETVNYQVRHNPDNATVTLIDPNTGAPLTGGALTAALQQQSQNLLDQGMTLTETAEGGQYRVGVAIDEELSETELLTQIHDTIVEIKNALDGEFTIRVNDQTSGIFNRIRANYESLRQYIYRNPVRIWAELVEQMYTGSMNSITGGTSGAGSGLAGLLSGNSSVAANFTGSVNGITGPAYADGSIGRLFSGARLANKTLVGELGPELAVYNGQYHLLGQSGAEFVKLPKSAIVFNHLQTAGILNGQMKDARGMPLTPNAFATGNVSGPALADGSGVSAALSAVQRAKSVWEGILNSLTAADLLGGGSGGGGGGNDLKAHIADLQEWYNLSRQIARVEAEINTLLSKRKNITDGHEYLRNLRETQSLLDDQIDTQKDLLRFQELQLKHQADHINNNAIWSQFLEVDKNGLLQYKKGNETNGGKGALEVLSQMNDMSGAEQLAFVQSLGWSYTTNEGEELTDSELVAKFYEELQKQIDDYDSLSDTVNGTISTLEDLEGQINEIEQEIRENELDLAEEIYDIIVDAWKENIENLKEQNDLIKEANEAYAQSIEKAISAERDLYEQNQSIQEREQMQRQLALLRRSGGSASEIANLEAQLDERLREEYFTNQEKALENIQETNERQVKLMEQQVKMQEEQLKYQEENGIIWSKVYEVMQGTDAEILQFMQGNSTEFFQKSYLEQEDMLTEWAKKVGIYNENKAYENYNAEAAASLNSVWSSSEGKSLRSAFNRANAEQQEKWLREYNDTYAAMRLNNSSKSEAINTARKEMFEHIRHWLEAEADGWTENTAPITRYATGGLVESTGLAWVDGTKSRPERVLSAEQTRILEEGLAMNAGRGTKLQEALQGFAYSLGSSIQSSIASIIKDSNNVNAFNIQPGAVVLQIAELNDKYDVDELFNDVADRLYSIAAKSSGRSVSRR